MPCFDAQAAQEAREAPEKIAFLEAALCAALKALHSSRVMMVEMDTSDDPDYSDEFSLIDFEEAGISKEKLVEWQRDHEARDRLRKRFGKR